MHVTQPDYRLQRATEGFGEGRPEFFPICDCPPFLSSTALAHRPTERTQNPNLKSAKRFYGRHPSVEYEPGSRCHILSLASAQSRLYQARRHVAVQRRPEPQAGGPGRRHPVAKGAATISERRCSCWGLAKRDARVYPAAGAAVATNGASTGRGTPSTMLLKKQTLLTKIQHQVVPPPFINPSPGYECFG